VGITSDDASALTGAEHVTRVVVAGANVSGVDFGFSFNAVTNTLAGDAQDDDLAANRTVQGSLRQFIQNANAVTGANAMRFVPAVPTNDTDGANNWWEVTVTSQLPAVTDAFTTINGTAYSFSDGTSLRDTNPGLLGSGGTVGVDGLVLDQVAATELEIAGVNTVDYGIRIETDDVQVRNLAIYGFGNTDQEGNIWVQDGYRNAWIEGNLIGSEAGGFSDPGAGLRTMGIGIYVSGADDGTIRNNLIGYTVSGGIYITGLGVASTGWLIEDNEVSTPGMAPAATSSKTTPSPATESVLQSPMKSSVSHCWSMVTQLIAISFSKTTGPVSWYWRMLSETQLRKTASTITARF
jgi:hypothetical protein